MKKKNNFNDTNNNENKDDLEDKEFDMMFKKDIEELKSQMNKYKLSDEFKNELKQKLDYEYNKPPEKKKTKNFFIPKKLVASLACCILIFSSCFAFGDEIGNWVESIFSNTDKIVEQAIKEDNYEEINMDYIENNGISVKVDYVVKAENNIYIAFNVLTDEVYDDLYFEDVDILNKENIVIYSSNNYPTNIEYTFNVVKKYMSKQNFYILYNLKEVENKKIEENILNIKLKNIGVTKNKILELKPYEYNLEINF